MPNSRWLVALALLLFPGSAQADEKLEKKLFLLNRALRNQDCYQAKQMAEKLVEEFSEDSDPYLAMARSHMCRGDYVQAWLNLQFYFDREGSLRGVKEIQNTIHSNVALGTLEVSPTGLEIPDDFDSGLDVHFPSTSAQVMVGERSWKFAVEEGSRTVAISHDNPLVGTWSQNIEFVEGLTEKILAEPVIQLGDLVVTVEPAEESGNVSLSVESRYGNFPLNEAEPGQFSGRLRAGVGSLVVMPLDPRISYMESEIVVEAGTKVETVVSLTRLEPATLVVGDLDSNWQLSLALPTGLEKIATAGERVETGAGNVAWSALLGSHGESLDYTFMISAGDSALPLPSFAAAVIDDTTVAMQMVTSGSEERLDLPLEGFIPGSDPRERFKLIALDVRPGEVRIVRLRAKDVPALAHHAEWVAAQPRVQSARTATIVSGAATAILGATTALLLRNVNALSEEARGIDDPAGLSYYELVLDEAETMAKRGNIALYTSMAAATVTVGFTWSTLRHSREMNRAFDAFTAAKREPYAVGPSGGSRSPSSLGPMGMED